MKKVRKKTMHDLNLDKVRFVRVTNAEHFKRHSHLKGLQLNKRYPLLDKKLIKENGRVISSYDLRNLIYKKALTVCL